MGLSSWEEEEIETNIKNSLIDVLQGKDSNLGFDDLPNKSDYEMVLASVLSKALESMGVVGSVRMEGLGK